MQSEDREIIEQVKPYSMQTRIRIYSLLRAVEYVIEQKIPGDFVECGVWRGGGMMAIALKLVKMGIKDRYLRLYDTFEGMSSPKRVDVQSRTGISAQALLDEDLTKSSGIWAVASLNEVRQNMLATKYPIENCDFVKGDVSQTLTQVATDPICLLRVDVDWHEPTQRCLRYLYPRLSANGIFISDDYGHWAGAKLAVDEYFSGLQEAPLLTPVDNDCVMGQKPA